MLQRTIRYAVAAVVLSVSAGGAAADSVLIESDDLGGSLIADSRVVFDLYQADSPSFTHSALYAMHEELHAGGIVTDAMVTVALVNTDHGLSIMTLIDDETVRQGSREFDSQIGFDASAPSTAEIFINGNSDLGEIAIEESGGMLMASGIFTWKSERRGDALAWANLFVGDSGEFTFHQNGPEFPTHPGLDESTPFQFVSWNGSTWERLSYGQFNEDGDFSFTWTIIPAPSAALVVLGGLLSSAGVSRRRRR